MRYLKEFAEVVRRRQTKIAPAFDYATDRTEKLKHAERDKAERDCYTNDMAVINAQPFHRP